MKNIEIINIEAKKSPEGSLVFFELGKEIDFEIKRIYCIYEFNQKNSRGFHAHKKLKQVIWCSYGKIEIYFTDGKNNKKYILDNPTKILVIKQGYWREFTSLEDNSVLCVGASDIYCENDYIRSYEKYLNWVEENYDNENTI